MSCTRREVLALTAAAAGGALVDGACASAPARPDPAGPPWMPLEPIAIDWAMREVATAQVHVEDLGDGRQRRTITHAPWVGITPAMMLWYLGHVDQKLSWHGNDDVIAYRYWHPRDHIHFKIDGPFGPGCRFHIVEAFQRNPDFLIDDIFHVMKVDESGFEMEIRLGDVAVAHMNERFVRTAEGMRMVVEQTIGTTDPLLRLPLQIIRWQHQALLEAWIRHNVEEVGNIPHFLPALYAAHQGAAVSSGA